MNACNKAAPAGSCKLVKSTCGQGSADTPTDDKNSALSGLREGGSGNASGLPSATKPTEGQGSSLSLLPKEDQGSAGNGSGLPSGARLPEGQASPLPALPGGVATTVRPGVYRLSGINGRGDTFTGMAALNKDGDKFRLTVWNGAKTLRATGQSADGILKMKYTDGNQSHLHAQERRVARWQMGQRRRKRKVRAGRFHCHDRHAACRRRLQRRRQAA